MRISEMIYFFCNLKIMFTRYDDLGDSISIHRIDCCTPWRHTQFAANHQWQHQVTRTCRNMCPDEVFCECIRIYCAAFFGGSVGFASSIAAVVVARRTGLNLPWPKINRWWTVPWLNRRAFIPIHSFFMVCGTAIGFVIATDKSMIHYLRALSHPEITEVHPGQLSSTASKKGPYERTWQDYVYKNR